MKFKSKKNWRLVLYLALFFNHNFVVSQQSYFQQRIDYKLDVALNDENHSLRAFEEIKYVNNSQQALDVIYFHLWPNAYKNSSTALAKQLLWQGKTDFYYSKPEERGYLDSLDFKVNGKLIKWEYDKEHIDICKLILNEPIRPSDSIIITTPFFLKIPDAKFSRLGHTNQAYYMTQWYPKPAVYDRKGWHQMPYLDQGEFFSEFGSFDVKITLPDNYVLCATGDKESNSDEEDFLNKKINETLKAIEKSPKDKQDESSFSTPVSTKLFKTIRFRQSQVHDFAWFADKRFYVMRDSVELPESKRKVNTWVYFTPKNLEFWKDAITYIGKSTVFYSLHNGDYPYNNVSALDGSIMAGGGMEYPNITVIGDVSSAIELDMVIAHEVGHNWFYGILGSNERDHPFLDEGVNSFVELRYMRTNYPEKKLGAFIQKDSTFKLFGLNKFPFWKYQELPFYSAIRKRTDQEIFLASTDFTESNYGAIVYGKSALVLDYLMDYMGENVLDKAMHSYFETYKFKHPSPNDFFKTLNEFSGKDLNDFQKHLIYSTAKIDYKITKVKLKKEGGYTLTLKNKTNAILPFNITSYDKTNTPIDVKWYDGFENKREITITSAEVDHFKIDGQNRMPDINRKNNIIKAQGLFKRSRPLRLSFLSRFEEPSRTNINYIPMIAGNYYNGAMVGMAFHNYGFYERRFEYLIAPMFAFNTKTPVGFLEFNYNAYPKKVFQQITIGAKAKTFAYDQFKTKFVNEILSTNYQDLPLNFYKIAPYVKFELKKKNPLSHISQFITYSNTNLLVDSLDTKAFVTGEGLKKKTEYSFVNQLNYDLKNARAIDPFSFNISLQHTSSMAKISGALNYKIALNKKHSIDLRVFAGAFLAGNSNERGYYAFRASGYNGWHDYMFDGNYVARNERGGFGFSQFIEKDGALKIWTPLGQSAEWLTSVNIKSPRAFKFIRVFGDLVVCDGRSLLNDKFLWDAGFNLVFWNDIIEVYIPLVYNTDIKKTLDLNKVSFPNTIRFTFNIHKLGIKSILQNSFF
ncbi:M1 family metallopeptidase [Aurantibacillus circumpalustris]|uniref:M1 family metallopeptidase n=1 Tax=Aurantibacillus circumpalustris TaxID=3036359 RepID=UPI00295B7C59|nr:M1 family metallopeptidase [Aurantibacillus circumpalustris]